MGQIKGKITGCEKERTEEKNTEQDIIVTKKVLTGYRCLGNVVELQYEAEKLYLEIVAEEIVRVCGKEPGRIQSRAIESRIDSICEYSISDAGDSVAINTRLMRVVAGNDMHVDFYRYNGEPLCLEYEKERVTIVRETMDGNAGAEGIIIEGEKQYYPVITVKQMTGDEHFYGLGLTTGQLDKRGCRYEFWNTDYPQPHVDGVKSLYESVPFLITQSNKASFGIFFDNTYKTCFDLGKENSSYYYLASEGGVLDYYFIYGERVADIVTSYTSLTGRISMPPLWALGYQQCRWSYAPEEKLLEIAEQFRERNIPCDALYLDIDYMDGYRVFSWDNNRFEEPEKLVSTLAGLGYSLVTIIDPGVKYEEGYNIYEDGKQKRYFAEYPDGRLYVNQVWPGDAVFPDFTRADVRSWWGDQHRNLLEAGVAGIWNDMNEPAVFNGSMPDDICFGENKELQHKEVHNVYGLLMSKATCEGIRRWTGKRPFVITRACYAGIQKYSAVWTGDNASTWDNLRLSVTQLLNLGMSGIAFCGSDTGGFQGDCSAELLARWTQVSAFAPLFRNHSCSGTRVQEPWTFGPDTEDICREYIKLRYKLIPYYYDCFREACITGIPVVRPLFMEYDDEETYTINDEFLAGAELLVAPVLEQGKRVRSVYLPNGSWYDFVTGLKYKCGYHLRRTPLSSCPVYVRAGSIIPMWPAGQNTKELRNKEITFRVYPGEGEYLHYVDDGESLDYEKGSYRSIRLAIHEIADGEYELSAECIHDEYKPSCEACHFVIEGVNAESVTCNSTNIDIRIVDGHTEFNVRLADKCKFRIMTRCKPNMN